MRPSAAAFAFPQQPRPGDPEAIGLMLMVATLALLMVSRFRYRSFKDLGLLDRQSYIYVLPLAIVMIGLLIWPRWVMLAIAGSYLLSAPLVAVYRAIARSEPKKNVTPQDLTR